MSEGSRNGRQFLTSEERTQLTRIVAQLAWVQTGGPEGRHSFLNNNGLVHLAGELPLHANANLFAARLVAMTEEATDVLADPAGHHPLGALCMGVLKLPDAPHGERSFLGGVILRYRLVEDEGFLTMLEAEFGKAEAASWRDLQSNRKGTKIPNPFGRTGKLDGPPAYLVRQPLVDEVLNELRKGSSVSIVGESQTGKSSLLMYLCKYGPQMLGRAATDFVYIDMQVLHNDHDFYDCLCEELGIPGVRGFRLTHALRGRQVVLCIDEVEKMTWQEFSRETRSELRGLADGATTPFTLVIASRLPLSRLFPDSGEMTSPLAGLCVPYNMPPFSLQETKLLVSQYLLETGLSLPERTIEEVWQHSAGQPAQLQQGLKHAFARLFRSMDGHG